MKNDLPNQKMFCENIKNMTDEQILTALKNKSDYNPLFVELAMKEIRIRGYNMNVSIRPTAPEISTV